MAGMSISGGGSSTLTVSSIGDASLAEQQTQSGLLQDIKDNQTNDTQTTKITDGTNDLQITGANEAKTRIDAVKGDVDALNSTILPLGIGGVFTGSWVETLNKSAIQVGVESDQNSATNGFRVEFSQDGTNVAHYHDYTYEAGDGVGYLFQPEFKYYRVKYTNGAVAQTKLTIAAVLKPVSLFPSQYRVNKAITGQSQALVTKGVIYGESTAGGGSYHSVKVTPSGAVASDATLSGLDAAVLGQETMANSLPVVISSDQSTLSVSGPLTDAQLRATAVPVSAASLPLPSGAATEATLADVKTSVQLLDNAISGNEMQVDVVTLPVDYNAGVTGAATQRVVIASDQAPTSGAQAWFSKVSDGTNTAAVKAASTAPVAADPALVVAVSPNSVMPSTIGRAKVDQFFHDYASTNVTTSGYTTINKLPSGTTTASAANAIEIFDSSGESLILAVNSVDQILIMPGGNGLIPLAIPSGATITVKAKTATASSGFLAINLYS